MKITKKYTVEGAHIVRNCTSERCSHSIHGHSALIEVCLTSSRLDNAQMVYDFGLMKGPIGKFIDSMDHTYLLCKNDDPEFIESIKKFSDRYIILPFNPTAEMLSAFICKSVNKILSLTKMSNGETDVDELGGPICKSVIYHETATGSAECDLDQDKMIFDSIDLRQVEFSPAIVSDWENAGVKQLVDVFRQSEGDDRYFTFFINPTIEQQIEL